MHSSIGQNITPFGVDKIVTSFMDRPSPNLEHSFYVWCTIKDFFETDPCLTVGLLVTEVVATHGPPAMLPLDVFCRMART